MRPPSPRWLPRTGLIPCTDGSRGTVGLGSRPLLPQAYAPVPRQSPEDELLGSSPPAVESRPHWLSAALLSTEHGAQTTVMCASEGPFQGGRYYYRCDVADSSDDRRGGTASRLLRERSDAWARTLAIPGGSDHAGNGDTD